MTERHRTISFIAWESDSARLDALANYFGVSAHLLFVPRRKRTSSSRALRWIGLGHVAYRYVRQGAATVQRLATDRPNVVVVQNPPIVLAMLASVYAFLPGRGFVIDSHTGAFSAWSWSLRLHRWLSQRAIITLVHNQEIADIIEDWDVDVLMLGYVESSYPRPVVPDFLNSEQPAVAVVCRHGAGDEPIDEIYAAANRLPDVHFYITGDANRLPAAQRDALPENCFLTGFVPHEEFIGLLVESDAVMSLTTRENTLQSGGIEAVSLGRVLITSDTTTLRNAFSSGAVFVDNTGEGIAQGVRDALARGESLRSDAAEFHRVLTSQWHEKMEELQRVTSVARDPSLLVGRQDESSDGDA